MRNFILKRYYLINVVSDPIDNITQYWFSDASKLAYGAFVYIRSIQSSGNAAVNLVTSKSRVIPMKKKYTIPCLKLFKLLATFILRQLIVEVLNLLN